MNMPIKRRHIHLLLHVITVLWALNSMTLHILDHKNMLAVYAVNSTNTYSVPGTILGYAYSLGFEKKVKISKQ